MTRRSYAQVLGGLAGLSGTGMLGAGTANAAEVNPNDPGILEPVLTELNDTTTRIPNTDQTKDGELLNQVRFSEVDASGEQSLTGHDITHVANPHRDLNEALKTLSDATDAGDESTMDATAAEIVAILKGETQGRIYDGFAMLNVSRGGFLPDHVDGEYKMKRLRDSGETAASIDGKERTIWEVDVNMLWYGGQFDSDTFLLRVPIDAHKFDLLRVNYRIYTLEEEDFAPTTVTMDARAPTAVKFPFKGFDSVWTPLSGDTVAEVTVDHPPLKLMRGVYTWGWREHPPRIHFLQPVYEQKNVHTGDVELDPVGQSFAKRNRELSIDGIGAAAPERKMYDVAQAALDDTATADEIHDMLTDPAVEPRGTWDGWVDLASDQNQLPPEARDVLAAEGIDDGKFGPYRYVTVYLNNEMYGDGPDGSTTIQAWDQGEQFDVKVINLDAHTHYFRVVDFGPRLHDDIETTQPSGSHSFEIMNFGPMYGAPKVAEMQWRAGWGFRPHHNVIQQQDVFARAADREQLVEYTGGEGNTFEGYLFSADQQVDRWRFNPPKTVIGTTGDPTTPSSQKLAEADGTEGLIVGTETEGWGRAKMCSHDDHPPDEFCEEDVSDIHPKGVVNVDTDGDGEKDALWFPPFLRTPAEKGGDIIPPNPAWQPFLSLNPDNGTLFIDPADPSKGYWADETYVHGRPVFATDDITTTVEMPRASAQVFYQFDPLFHDNAIFSPHPD